MRRYSYLVAVVLMATVVVPILGVASPALAVDFTSSPNVAVPDDGYIGVLDTNDGFGVDAGMVCDIIDTSGPVGAGATVTSVGVDLGLTHTWIGDVTVKLQSPDGTILAIMERVQGDANNPLGDDGTSSLGDSSNLDGALLHFADGNPVDSESMGLGIDGSQFVGTDDGVFDYFPNPDQALVVGSSVADFAAFNGGPAAGPWTLCVGDSFNGDLGTFETWTLQLGSADDAVDPVVTVVSPAVGDVFDLNEVVVADYECADGGSGVASCDGDVADGAALDTSTLGAHSFTVTGTDNAGNSTVITHNYLVVDGSVPAIDSEWLLFGGAEHVAVLLVDPMTGDTWVDVRKVSDGSLVSSVSFGSSYVGTDLEAINTDSDPGEAFLVVLGTRADGAVRATSKYAVSGALVARANFGAVYSGTDLEAVAVNASGPIVTVLGTHSVNENVRVQTREPDDSVRSTVYLGTAWTGDDLEGNFPNVGVLGTKVSNGNVRVRTINPFTGSVVDTAYWGNAFTGSDVEAVGADWAVLQERVTTGAVRVQTRTTAGAKVGTASFGLSTYVPTDLEVLGFPGDVAVLGTSTTNQAVRVQTRTVAGVLVGFSQYGTAYSGIDLEADSDLGVLGLKATNGKIRDQIRTTSGFLISTIDYN